MSPLDTDIGAKALAFSSALEFATGLAFLTVPGLVIPWLIGEPATVQGALLGRLVGVALLALGIACWPGRPVSAAAQRGMLSYNVLVALLLIYFSTSLHLTGKLLWPAVALHSFLTLFLLRTCGEEPPG